jgi:hypothetical protein
MSYALPSTMYAEKTRLVIVQFAGAQRSTGFSPTVKARARLNGYVVNSTSSLKRSAGK